MMEPGETCKKCDHVHRFGRICGVVGCHCEFKYKKPEKNAEGAK
jgi:hypothetical protein